MTTRRATDITAALDAFIATKAEIYAMLARIADLNDPHFKASPGEIHGCYVGDMRCTASQLREILDACFKVGAQASSALPASLACSPPKKPAHTAPSDEQSSN